MSQEPSKVSPQAVIASGQKVLATESAALAQMAAELPADFAPVVELILGAKGRVIVSGIGKSGHIGRKIAATLASTGTPSYFVHCAEASHGDLGMVTPADICLLISNSGETTELQDILAHTRRFSIPTVAISSKPDSTLMKAADYRLCLPPAPEACSIGMAPTTSTTLTLALGDALAVALMDQRGFLPEDFRVFHPGGKLGAQLATVAQLMHTGDDLPLVTADTPMQDCLLTMTSKGFGIAAVVEADRLSGVISDGDLRRNMAQLMRATAGDIASKDPITVAPDELAASALAIMNARKISVLMVVDTTGAPVGILHIHDLLRAGVA
ncbi:KpsF/GutQ family sugar-phosphate isomerase [Epibacterium sp. SM1979]|uniref:KpsF/GutQ family sugar-phosphate isomerase n=1 Tax=Tritonibacter litoralis TaxID=2662264 RepID=A0A843YID1_9RHOB|nr:KpsF/GutQ family sugar-phosphate isomerase [Tritonibacter litoralis]MQQ09558.1 KpsF/GutQ family sugar-phosphate isomerase [Tritonibacter litoralis]